MGFSAIRRLFAGGFVLAALGWGSAWSAPAMDFAPNPPGSYHLQRIMTAGDGRVLDSRGRERRLREFTRGRITLLSFIYSSCADPDGCPYAYTVFHLVRSRLESLPEARGQVRLLSLSFDPVRDTPEQLTLYGGPEANREAPIRWDYLTTRGLSALLPVLQDFGQDISVDMDDAGRPRGTFSHVLKVFLIDRRGVVREIYTTAYLLPAVVVNDIKTLLIEEGRLKP
jgi:cytochrome oxidase Cu insertion factor (SCO1/SenC/PrrC family)